MGNYIYLCPRVDEIAQPTRRVPGTQERKTMKTYKVIENATGRDLTPGFDGQLPFFRLTVVNGKYHVISDMGEDITNSISFVKC